MGMLNNVVILLTACIDPKGMAFTAIQDKNERLLQYRKALQWYLENTKWPIVFVENSNYDITPMFKKYVECGRLEIITFDGNSYDKSLGKGYGEALIIEYGINNSRIINNSTILLKVTGRLIAHGAPRILNSIKDISGYVYADWHEDCRVGLKKVNSQFVIAPITFWEEYFLPFKGVLNDSKNFFFEHLLKDAIIRWSEDGFHFSELPFCAQFEGVSGSRGVKFRPSMKNEVRHFIRTHLFHPLHYFGPINPIGIIKHVINGKKT